MRGLSLSSAHLRQIVLNIPGRPCSDLGVISGSRKSWQDIRDGHRRFEQDYIFPAKSPLEGLASGISIGGKIPREPPQEVLVSQHDRTKVTLVATVTSPLNACGSASDDSCVHELATSTERHAEPVMAEASRDPICIALSQA